MNTEETKLDAQGNSIKPLVRRSLLADLKEIIELYEKLDLAYKKINPEATMMDFERGCYETTKNIVARMEANNDC